MENRIKTALERALERMKGFKEVAPEEIEKMEYIPRGRSLGAAFLKDENFDLPKSLAEFAGTVRGFIIEGIQEILLLNITLPVSDDARSSNRRAMEGIIAVKADQKRALEVINELEYLLDYYQQSLNQTKEKFKEEYAMKSRMSRRVPGQRPGGAQDVERQMGFREEWARVLAQLNERFERALGEAKAKIRGLE